tara:strand:- start:241 stop:759 length:519 start_codon:yes stop_codon:yes gene_type:complete
MTMTPEKTLRMRELYEEMCDIMDGADWTSYARIREIILASELKHEVAETYSEEDATNQRGEKVEYKTTIQDNIQGAYTGISVKNTWEEQLKYLEEEKIGCYPEHYFARFTKGGKIAEVYVLCGEDVLQLIIPPIKRKFDRGGFTKKGTVLADQRLAHTIGKTKILKYGKKIR